MREVNFSVPSANRASVGITTTLYDRRALDCTSTLPLVNSLNHLAYLTTSSPRIREILTIDGGIERLVYLLKCGKTKDMMDTWKWSLAFQCVVNVAVRGSDAKGADSRGSETIRTRVVEADVVPVVTSILDSYMKIMEQIREQEAQEKEKSGKTPAKRPTSSREDVNLLSIDTRHDRRRHVPPAIGPAQIPFLGATPIANTPTENMFDERPRSENTPPPPPASHVQLGRQVHDPIARPRNPWLTVQSPQTEAGSSQPHTPITPLPLGRLPVLTTRYPTRRRSASAGYLLPVTSQQQDLALSGDSDDGDATPQRIEEPEVPEGTTVDMEMDARSVDLTLLGDATATMTMADPDITGGDDDAETFSITHRSLNGSIIEPIAPPADQTIAISPTAPPIVLLETGTRADTLMTDAMLTQALTAPVGLAAQLPRDEDVIMALQLLAYVSKYCHLRTYFEQSHLVPRLKLKDGCLVTTGEEVDYEEDNDDEYCRPTDYNIFPLIEKYTVRNGNTDMNYWACVVMRNLCRKDKSRGDIRQCAYWKCGKWEEFARQFAKCRRCRQTKYCSKACQKSGWTYHRHWCEPAKDVKVSHQRSSRHAGTAEVDADGDVAIE